MNDELPEIFEQITPPPAPPALRPRVLAAVEGELAKRRKPRWERVLELSVAASFVLGVGLNAWDFSRGVRGFGPLWISGKSQALSEQIAGHEGANEDLHRMPNRFVPGSFDTQYAKYLADLMRKPSG